ncbi:MAG: isoleucine--tRNA ligase [Clostridia bacterium]|nr:isoleucine--tRNA ligase [Clostridia bacterium]
MGVDYRKTVCLPKTSFPMRADLPRREPELLARWTAEDLYGQLRRARLGRPKWVLHDGPPYASGTAHIGTAMNKVLKDMVVRFATLFGYDAPYVPGWDTHGLPIEHRVMREAGLDLHRSDPLEIRRRCEEFALANIRAMTEQFRRLGVLGDWDHPYRTLDPEFEAEEVRVFARMVERGYVFRGLRPVYWCPSCETALAEAEIEYAERESPSVWIAFPVEDGAGVLPEGARLLVWTTTPWTIPANQAIAVHPEATYDAVEVGGSTFVVAHERLGPIARLVGWADGEFAIVASFPGESLAGVRYRHPLFPRVSPVVHAEHVTMDEGTGLVHTAPGHGHEDFAVGRREGLPVVVPVDAQGRMTDEAGPFAGLPLAQAEARIQEALRQAGALLLASRIRHSYPHCWRCHSPVIFRATEQWFVDVEKLKEPAMKAADDVRWWPAWGAERMKEMVAGRGDWCLSRQRVWGVPIPVFYCEACGAPLLTPGALEAVAQLFAERGGDAWWRLPAGEILPEGTACPACGGTSFRKERDVFDVWLDSGCTHAAVLARRPELKWPADLYLEGHNDQFRGWYQSSLLTSVATRGRAPYEGVLSHGFVVDAEGRHMHKSWGNAVDPLEVVERYGADVFRLWVASTDYTADVRIGDAILEQVAEVYRKIRNTVRFLLGHVEGEEAAAFEPILARPEELPDLDAWVLRRAAEVQAAIQAAARRYDYRAVYNQIHTFCVNDLSAFYLNARKDVLYTTSPAGFARKAAQAAIWSVARALVTWLAPILPFTAEEAWGHLPRGASDPRSVHLAEWPEIPAVPERPARRIEALLALKGRVDAAIEGLRQSGALREPSEARVALSLGGEPFVLLRELGPEATAEALVVSEVELAPGDAGAEPGVTVSASGHPKCARCWRYVADVGGEPGYPDICRRCARVVAELEGAEGVPAG